MVKIKRIEHMCFTDLQKDALITSPKRREPQKLPLGLSYTRILLKGSGTFTLFFQFHSRTGFRIWCARASVDFSLSRPGSSNRILSGPRRSSNMWFVSTNFCSRSAMSSCGEKTS